MEIMYDRKTKRRLEVFAFDVDHGIALYYDSRLASGNGGNGFQKIPIKNLIPEAYYCVASESFMSKTERNDIKSHLKLAAAIWECEDGVQYPHSEIDFAIEHQRELMKMKEEI